jgi:hypothetical protein
MTDNIQKTVVEMTEIELIKLRNRIYNQKRKDNSERLTLQLHAVNGELKDRGHITKHQAKLAEYRSK